MAQNRAKIFDWKAKPLNYSLKFATILLAHAPQQNVYMCAG